MESHAVIIRTPLTLPPEKDEWVERLLMRIDGVQQVTGADDPARRKQACGRQSTQRSQSSYRQECCAHDC